MIIGEANDRDAAVTLAAELCEAHNDLRNDGLRLVQVAPNMLQRQDGGLVVLLVQARDSWELHDADARAVTTAQDAQRLDEKAALVAEKAVAEERVAELTASILERDRPGDPFAEPAPARARSRVK